MSIRNCKINSLLDSLPFWITNSKDDSYRIWFNISFICFHPPIMILRSPFSPVFDRFFEINVSMFSLIWSRTAKRPVSVGDQLSTTKQPTTKRSVSVELNDAGALFDELMNLLLKLANYGVIHSDFNEFNIMIDENEKPILIDFPQMISTSHCEAEE